MASKTEKDSTEQQTGNGWRPEPGDTISGKVTDLDMAADIGWGPYPIVTIAREDGTEVSVHAFHQTLRSKLEQIRPQIGDPLNVTYIGKQSGKGDSPDYHLYRVRSAIQREFWGPAQTDNQKSDDLPF